MDSFKNSKDQERKSTKITKWRLYLDCEHSQMSTTVNRVGRRVMCSRCGHRMQTVRHVEPVEEAS